MTVGSLFSGIGGFDLGLERAGHGVAWQVEIDPKCRELLASKFPTAALHEDVTHAGAANLARVDCICGGFPCQDLSVAGRRAGLAGERSGLWHQFHRILGELAPRWCVIENVPGLLSSNGGRDFGIILAGLVELGYRVTWRVLDAQYFGLAQRRKRVFIVGSLGDGRSAEVLLEPEGVRWNPPPRRTPREGTAPTLASRARGGGGLGTDAECDGAVVPAFTLSPARGTGDGHGNAYGDGGDNMVVTPALQAGSPTYERGDGSLFCVPDVAWALQERDAKGADSDTKEGRLIAGFDPRNVTSKANRTRITEGLTPTLHEHGQSIIGQGVRRLTPRECERLQGFPDDWTAGFADTTRYKVLGNAVAVPVAEWIGRRLT